MLCGKFWDNDRRMELLQACVFVIWRIWKNKNEMVFNGVLVNPLEMVNVMRRSLLEFRARLGSKRSDEGDGAEGSGVSVVGKRVRWMSPPFRVLKINYDGA